MKSLQKEIKTGTFEKGNKDEIIAKGNQGKMSGKGISKMRWVGKKVIKTR
jgi:hypothetical protein